MGFQPVTGDTAILCSNGVFQQCDLYEWGGGLFAEVSGGKFVRLRADGSTSKTSVRLEYLDYAGPLFRDRLGRLLITQSDGAVPLTALPNGTLLETK